MKRKTLSLAAAVVVLMFSCATWGVTYHGELSYDSGMLGAGNWAAAGTKLEWWVTDISTETTTLWEYKYCLSVADTPSPSHMIIQTTPDVFTLSSVVYEDGSIEYEIKWFDPTPDDKKPNPYLPASVYGVKFDGFEDDLTICLSFESPNTPVWHDYYSVGGSPGHDNFGAIWNRGFLLDNPLVDPDNGSVNWHILAPNSPGEPGGGDPLPEPLSMLGVLMGIGGVSAYVRRRLR